jgi:PAS domain S-box-containing protein
MTRLFPSSLRLRLFLLIFLALSVPFVWIFYDESAEIRAASAEAERTALSLARIAATQHERLIEDAHLLLVLLSKLPVISNPSACKALFPELPRKYPRFRNFIINDTDGKIECSSITDPVMQQVNFADRAWFRDAIATRRFVTSEYLVGKLSQHPTLVFALPIIDSAGNVRAVISAATSLEWLSRFNREAQLPEGSVITVIDRNGTVLAHEPDPQGWTGKAYPEAAISKLILNQKQDGTAKTTGLDGISRLFAFTPLGDTEGAAASAYLFVGIPPNTAYVGVRMVKQKLVWVSLLTLLVLGAAWFGSDVFFLRRIESLLAASNRLASGDLGTRAGLPHEQDELGQLAGAFDHMAEALQQREAERENAERSRAQLAAIVESSADAIIGRSPDGIITSWNKGAENVFGYSAEEAIGGTLDEIIPANERFLRERVLDRIKRGERITPYETVRLRKDGTPIHASITVSPVNDYNGTLIGTSAIVRDISEQKRAMELHARLAALVESSNDAIFSGTLDGILTSWNKGAEILFGYTAEEIIGQSVMMLVPPDNHENMRRNAERIQRGEPVAPYESMRLRKGGAPFHVSVRISPIIDASGAIIGISSITRDITEQKQAEEKLRQQNEILQKIFDQIPVMMIFIDAEGGIKLVNREWERMHGWTLEEIKRSHLDLFAAIYPDPRERQKFLDFTAAANGQWRDFRTKVRDGRVLETTWANARLSDGTIISIGADITQRKRAAVELTALHDINLAITSTLELPEILRILLERIDTILPYAASHIRLINKTTGKIEPVTCRNIDEARWKEGTEGTHHSIHHDIVQSKRPLTIRNLQQDSRAVWRREFYRDQGLTSYLGVPLVVKEEAIGVLSFFTKGEHDFTRQEIAFAETLAKQASIAIHNSQLYERGKVLSEELLGSKNDIRALANRLMHAKDEEAKRIARVLHEESGQVLAMVYIALDDLAKTLDGYGKEPIRRIKELLDRVEGQLRDLSHELHPAMLDNLGLIPSLEFLCQQVSKRYGIEVVTEAQLNHRPSPVVTLTLYRIAQEALNNAARHARANKVTIKLLEDEGLLQYSIQDNGTGFRSTPEKKAQGLGLVEIRERVAAIGGTFQLFSAPGAGTKLFITVRQETLDGLPRPSC